MSIWSICSCALVCDVLAYWLGQDGFVVCKGDAGAMSFIRTVPSQVMCDDAKSICVVSENRCDHDNVVENAKRLILRC